MMQYYKGTDKAGNVSMFDFSLVGLRNAQLLAQTVGEIKLQVITVKDAQKEGKINYGAA